MVVKLAELASKGTYQVTPEGARNMNNLFDQVARVINELETEEKESTSE